MAKRRAFSPVSQLQDPTLDSRTDTAEQAAVERELAKGNALVIPAGEASPIEKTRLDPQITGNVGLYYCCYQLSLRGWNVMPTARNARGVDIIAYSRDATRFIGIQVKALTKRNPVPLGTSLENVAGNFWVIVDKVTSFPSAFVLLPSEVRELAHRGEKDGRVSFWLQPTDYDREPFKDAWGRIGQG